MDCCEFRGAPRGLPAGAYAAAPWDAPYAPYAPYAYYPHHDPYRYYRYDYAHHAPHHNDHIMPMEYGAYAAKEARVRRSLSRRDARALTPSHHLPLPQPPPLECGMNGRAPAYCDPHLWPHYQQMGLGGWAGANAMAAGWMSRAAVSRDHGRYTPEYRPLKGPHMVPQNHMCPPEGKSTSYTMYEEAPYNGENSVRQRQTPEYPVPMQGSTETRKVYERVCPVPQCSPPEEKRPPVVPLPAFQQAFGSTEIGKFAEAFTRTEISLEDASNDNFSFESFPEWDGAAEPQWSAQPTPREIKCEDNY